MADNYTDLKGEIATWLARSGDSNITDNVDTFIDLAEADFNRVLRTDEMIAEATLTLSSGVGTVARPSDYLQTVSAYNDTDPQSIEFTTIKQIRDRYGVSSTGTLGILVSTQAASFCLALLQMEHTRLLCCTFKKYQH